MKGTSIIDRYFVRLFSFREAILITGSGHEED